MCNVDLLSIQKKNSIVKHQQRCQLMQFSSTNQVADHKRNNLISFRRVLPRSSPFACNGLMPFCLKFRFLLHVGGRCCCCFSVCFFRIILLWPHVIGFILLSVLSTQKTQTERTPLNGPNLMKLKF